jgi:hypothetical protein
MLRDALGVVDIVERAAAMLRRALIGEGTLQFGQAALIPELHGKPDDGASVLPQNGGDGGRIHSARHGNGDESGLSFSADRQRRFELGDFRHLCLFQFNLRARFCADVASDESLKIQEWAGATCAVLCSKSR